MPTAMQQIPDAPHSSTLPSMKNLPGSGAAEAVSHFT
jgi:hypothetical protein